MVFGLISQSFSSLANARLVNLADLERKQSERPTSVLRMIHVTYVYIVSCISEMGCYNVHTCCMLHVMSVKTNLHRL